MKRLAIAAALCCLCVSSANAGDKFGILGVGAQTCAARLRTQNTDDLHFTIVAWISGYLTHLNKFAAQQALFTGVASNPGDRLSDVTGKYSIDDVIAWARLWCSQHPLENIEGAADATANELLTRFANAHGVQPSREKLLGR